MNPDNTNLTGREREIETLKLVVAKNDLSMQVVRLTLARMEEKQILRRAELRCQELLLRRAQALVTRGEIERTVARMVE